MKDITVTHFVPLIGSFILSANKLGLKTEQIISFPGMAENEQHIYSNRINNDIEPILLPKEFLDEFDWSLDSMREEFKRLNLKKTNIVAAVPPCAAFSLLNTNTQVDGKANIVQIELLKYFLVSDSEVLVYENAPGLVGIKGLTFLLDYFQRLLNENNLQDRYKFTIVKTDTDQHGIPQHRPRTFVLLYKSKPETFYKINNQINSPLKQLKEIFSGLGFTETQENQHFGGLASRDIGSWINFFNSEIGMKIVKEVLAEKMDKEDYRFDIISRTFEKFNKGELAITVSEHPYVAKNLINLKIKCEEKGRIAYRDSGPIIFRGHSSAIVGRNQTNLTRLFNKDTLEDYFEEYLPRIKSEGKDPIKDLETVNLIGRQITFREKFRLMGFPDNFNLVNPIRNHNHICQNLTTCTSEAALQWAIQIFNKDNIEEITIPETKGYFLFQNNCNSKMNAEVLYCSLDNELIPISKLNEKSKGFNFKGKK